MLPATRTSPLARASKTGTEITAGTTVVLVDASGSMDQTDGGTTTRWHKAIEALRAWWPTRPPATRLASYSDEVHPAAHPDQMEFPACGTETAHALRYAVARRAALTLLLTDGNGNDEEAEIAAAHALTGPLHVIYCGPPSNAEAIRRCRKLARAANGKFRQVDLALQPKALEQAIRLCLPAPKGT